MSYFSKMVVSFVLSIVLVIVGLIGLTNASGPVVNESDTGVTIRGIISNSNFGGAPYLFMAFFFLLFAFYNFIEWRNLSKRNSASTFHPLERRSE